MHWNRMEWNGQDGSGRDGMVLDRKVSLLDGTAWDGMGIRGGP